MGSRIELANRNQCTGCTACASICSRKAIEMIEDKNGFVFPRIDEKACIECGLCVRTCPLLLKNNLPSNSNINTYAAYSNISEVLQTSSSGGIFALLAEYIINKGGVVFACMQDTGFDVRHIRIDSIQDIDKVKGSKYVQSKLVGIFQCVKNDLIDGKKVLFVGTPCQVLGLRSFLNHSYSELLTVDLVCHGVPSISFFKNYINWFEDRYRVHIDDYIFRDTVDKDMTCTSRIVVSTPKEKRMEYKTYYHPKYYFYYLYMIGAIYRESCYQCPCLPNKRASDITIGDYWGIEEIKPEISYNKGVSVVVTHTNIGEEVIKNINAIKYLTKYDDALLRNSSIEKSVQKPTIRDDILRYDQNQEYEKIYTLCKQLIGNKQFIIDMKRLVPVRFKRRVKAILHRKKLI